MAHGCVIETNKFITGLANMNTWKLNWQVLTLQVFFADFFLGLKVPLWVPTLHFCTLLHYPNPPYIDATFQWMPHINIPSSPIFCKMSVNQTRHSFTDQYILFVLGIRPPWPLLQFLNTTVGMVCVRWVSWACQNLAAAQCFLPSNLWSCFILGNCLLGIACRLLQKRWHWTGLLKKEPSERLPMRPGGLQNVSWTVDMLDGLSKWMQFISSLGIILLSTFPILRSL